MSSSSDSEDESATETRRNLTCLEGLRATPIMRLLTYLRITNMINALLVLMVFPLGFLTEALTLQISTAFFTGYSIIFAVILLIFECNCTCGTSPPSSSSSSDTATGSSSSSSSSSSANSAAAFSTEDRSSPARPKESSPFFLSAWAIAVRTNFGFLYSFVGRTCFLLFVASICLCAQTTSGYFMCVVTFLNAALNCVVLATHPAFKKGGQLSPFDDPTKVAENLKDVGVELAAQHPGLVNKAISKAKPSAEAAFSVIAKQVLKNGAAAEV